MHLHTGQVLRLFSQSYTTVFIFWGLTPMHRLQNIDPRADFKPTVLVIQGPTHSLGSLMQWSYAHLPVYVAPLSE